MQDPAFVAMVQSDWWLQQINGDAAMRAFVANTRRVEIIAEDSHGGKYYTALNLSRIVFPEKPRQDDTLGTSLLNGYAVFPRLGKQGSAHEPVRARSRKPDLSGQRQRPSAYDTTIGRAMTQDLQASNVWGIFTANEYPRGLGWFPCVSKSVLLITQFLLETPVAAACNDMGTTT